MQAFLSKVANHIYQNYEEKINRLCIVLPNKRGALFLKKFLSQEFNKTTWLPKIISAEDLINELAGLSKLEDIELSCILYESYCEIYGNEAEPFEAFIKWGNLILQDFNEIDRYLADAQQLYSNLKDIKEIENWSLAADDLTEFQKNYILFMERLGSIYKVFQSTLLKQNKSYQGLAYKTAVKNFKNHSFISNFDKLIFCGFNALNASETLIFSDLFKAGKAEMLWDIDPYYYKDIKQEAGLFLRKNIIEFGQKEINFMEEHFKEAKNFEIIAVPKQIGQAQAISNIIQQLLKSGETPDSIAVVLSNEKLLWPVLKMLPDEIEHVNITMEYPLKYSAAYSFVELLIKLQLDYEKQSKNQLFIYYKDFLNILRHNFFIEYAKTIGLKNINQIIHRILEKNYAFITEKILIELFNTEYNKIKHLFFRWTSNEEGINNINNVLGSVKSYHLSGELNNYKSIELEFLEILIRNFNRLEDFIKGYKYFNSVKVFKMLFQQILGSSSASFLGEPLRGLQIMGVLETRTLDFNNVIFVSVNEGVLPSGKSSNSFIPNDLKRHFGLPLYIEKDAIYAYHFYRLLQRTKNCFITYDTETDTFGKGEVSRFVSQLIYEFPKYNPSLNIKQSIAQSKSRFVKSNNEILIEKNASNFLNVHEKIFVDSQFTGLSPSSIISYKDCSLKFYFRYGLRLKESESLEESAEASTFGSILHECLEELYKPYINNLLNENLINQIKPHISKTVESSFLNYFTSTEAFFGKNLLQQKVLAVYIEKLLDFDVEQINKSDSNYIQLVALEDELKSEISLQHANQQKNAIIKGKIDRIDKYEGYYRVIDYKSSIKSSDKFEFANFDEMFNNKSYNKMLQLFIYAWMVWKNKLAPAELIQPCIIAFKKFEKDPKYLSYKRKPLIFTDDLLMEFEFNLKAYLEQILDEGLKIQQTNDFDVCEYCSYRTICNR